MTDFNLDGPHSPDLTKAAADQVAELVRYLCYATRSGQGGLESPADAYDLLGALGTAAERLPQLIGQADAYLAAQYNSGRLRSAGASPVARLVADAGAELNYCTGYALSLSARLHHAQNAISGLSVTEDGDD